MGGLGIVQALRRAERSTARPVSKAISMSAVRVGKQWNDDLDDCPLPWFAHELEPCTNHLRALAHDRQTPMHLRSGIVGIETLAVVHDTERYGIMAVRELDLHRGRPSVPDNIADGFLTDPQQLFFDPRRTATRRAGDAEVEPQRGVADDSFDRVSQRTGQVGSFKGRRAE